MMTSLHTGRLLKKASRLFQNIKNLSGTNFHASPTGVIDMDIDHQNLSGTNFHASSTGVIDMDNDHQNLSGTNFHASPKGVIDTDIDHQIEGLKAFDIAETTMFWRRPSRCGEFQQPARHKHLLAGQ